MDKMKKKVCVANVLMELHTSVKNLVNDLDEQNYQTAIQYYDNIIEKDYNEYSVMAAKEQIDRIECEHTLKEEYVQKILEFIETL